MATRVGPGRATAQTLPRTTLAQICFLGALLLLSASSCCAQEARWKELKGQWEKLEEQGKFGEELALLNQAAEIAEKTFGPADSRFGETLADLGNIQHTLGQMETGEATLKRALAIDEKALGPDHPDVACILQNLGTLYMDASRIAEADAMFKRTLAIREAKLGPNSAPVGETLNFLGQLADLQGKFSESEKLYLRSLDIREKSLGPEDASVGQTLHNMGFLYLDLGRYPDAEKAFKRALDIRTKALGPEHPDVGDTMSSLALTYADMSRWAESEQLYKKALSIREKALGPEHPDVATTLVNLAELYQKEARFSESEPRYQRAIKIYETALGSENSYVSITVSCLGDLYLSEGKYAQAEQQLQRAIALDEKVAGKEHPRVAHNLDLLGRVYSDQGRYDEARQVFDKSLSIEEKSLGKEHPDYAATLSVMAVVAKEQRRLAEAESLELQTLAIDERAYGKESVNYAIALDSLATIYDEENKRDAAEPLFQEALAILEKLLGKDSQVLANSAVNFGNLRAEQGRLDEAEALYARALAINEHMLGEDHPDVTHDLKLIAALYQREGKIDQASKTYDRALGDLLRRFRYYFTYMTEKQRLAYLATVSDYFPRYYSFCQQNYARDHELAGKMYDVALWQKGFIVNSIAAMRNRIASSKDPELLAMLDQLAIKKTQLASLLNNPGENRELWKAHVEEIQHDADALEAKLVANSKELSAEKKLETTTWKDVQRSLKPGEAAVEIVRFRSFDGVKLANASEYVALILTPETKSAPLMVDLGSSQKLEGAPLMEYRRLIRETPFPWKQPPTAFYKAFWAPLLPAIGAARKIYFSGDGALNQVSLGIIADENGRLLMERYHLHLVSSTRDLLRQETQAGRQEAVLIGDPKFDLPIEQYRAELQRSEPAQAPSQVLVAAKFDIPAGLSRGQTGAKCSLPDTGVLCPLPGTGMEVQTVQSLLQENHWRVDSYEGSEALEEVVKQVAHPRVLHLATHGFFLEDSGSSGGASSNVPVSDPMLRSGLYFAGADHALSGETMGDGLDDGVLTAYEAASLDLHGTELVVLSACDTGLGESKNGEGVFGLKRALQAAGAESVLMSQWSVPDLETQELMVLFYREWLAGTEKHEALRHAQLLMRQRVRARYGADIPYFWGAFVLVGN